MRDACCVVVVVVVVVVVGVAWRCSEVLFGYVDPEMAAASKLFGPRVVPPVYPGIVGNDTSLDAAATDLSGTHKFFTVQRTTLPCAPALGTAEG